MFVVFKIEIYPVIIVNLAIFIEIVHRELAVNGKSLVVKVANKFLMVILICEKLYCKELY